MMMAAVMEIFILSPFQPLDWRQSRRFRLIYMKMESFQPESKEASGDWRVRRSKWSALWAQVELVGPNLVGAARKVER